MHLKSIAEVGLPPYEEDSSKKVLAYSETHDFQGCQFIIMPVSEFYMHKPDDLDDRIGSDDANVITHWCYLEEPGKSMEDRYHAAAQVLSPALSSMVNSHDGWSSVFLQADVKRGYDALRLAMAKRNLAVAANTSAEVPYTRPLPEGSIIEFCDLRAYVIKDFGSKLQVITDDGYETSYQWSFDGESCKVVFVPPQTNADQEKSG
ncbi:hypothetical protein ACI2KR_06515 [Pseudomonas luteola]